MYNKLKYVHVKLKYKTEVCIEMVMEFEYLLTCVRMLYVVSVNIRTRIDCGDNNLI